jgi:hypothetical protein
MMRVRLLIDVAMDEGGIAHLQGLVGEQPMAVVLIEHYPAGLDGRFMGATMVEKEDKADASPAR